MKCTHPDHRDETSCEDFTVACNKLCKCCIPLISLFTYNEYYTDNANTIASELTSILQPVLNNWAKVVRIRELEYISHKVITDICLEILLLRKN
jgi:hypothetical protein